MRIEIEDREYMVDNTLAWCKEAKQEAVDYVLNQPVNTGDGRSEWYWVRFANGDLMLGVFPEGDTYFDVSEGRDGEHGDAEMEYE